MSGPLLVESLLCDWLSINFHYSYAIDRGQQRMIIAEALRAIRQKHEAIKMGEYSTAYQTERFMFISINKRFLQVQFQGKYFLNGNLIEAATIIQKIFKRLLKHEQIEGRPDTEITKSISRLDIQKTKISEGTFTLADIDSQFEHLSSFSHSFYGGKTKGTYRIYGETIKDKGRWKLRRYDKLIQVQSEYNEDEQKLFFERYPSAPMERIELQIADTPFLNKFLDNFRRHNLDLEALLTLWNTKRKIPIVNEQLIGLTPVINGQSKAIDQKRHSDVRLCKADVSSFLARLKDINAWVDRDPLANPAEVISQIVFALGHGKELAEQVRQVWLKI